MAEHTPAPWEWWTSNSWRRLRHSDRGVSTNVLLPTVNQEDGHPDIDVSQADMALIAAAPDMLAALKQLVTDYGDVPDPTDADGQAVFADARAAIAKADGSTLPSTVCNAIGDPLGASGSRPKGEAEPDRKAGLPEGSPVAITAAERKP